MRSKRKSRRAGERERERLVHDLERLAALEEGGAPRRPILVDTPAVVEIRAVSRPCPLCGGRLVLEQHAAEEIAGDRLRVATLVCAHCGVRRKRYFRLVGRVVH